MHDQRFIDVKYKKDGSAEYGLRMAHVHNIIGFLKTLNLGELDFVANELARCRKQFLEEEEKIRNGKFNPTS